MDQLNDLSGDGFDDLCVGNIKKQLDLRKLLAEQLEMLLSNSIL